MNVIKTILTNGYIPIIPILILNIIFTPKLPTAYDPKSFNNNIPLFLIIIEKIFRAIIFILPLFFKIDIFSNIGKIGLDMGKSVKMIEKFTLFQRITLQGSWFLIIILGNIGLFNINFRFGIFYLSFSIITSTFLLSVTLCRHCPYPCKYDSCLFMSPKIIKKYFKNVSPNMNILEKIIFVIIFLGIGLIPIYWLFISNIVIFIPFIIFVIYLYTYMFGCLCTKCYHYSCPFNRANKSNNT